MQLSPVIAKVDTTAGAAVLKSFKNIPDLTDAKEGVESEHRARLQESIL